MACDLRFFMSAMKPTPQESFSFVGIVEALRAPAAPGSRTERLGACPRGAGAEVFSRLTTSSSLPAAGFVGFLAPGSVIGSPRSLRSIS